MSASDHDRFDELLSRFLDAALEEGEDQELLQHLSDEALAARFDEMTRLDAEIAGLMAGSLPDEVMVELVWSDLAKIEDPSSPGKVEPRRAAAPVPTVLHRKSGQRTGLVLALAAVIAGVLGVAALHFFHPAAPAKEAATAPAGPATVASVRGEVYFIGPAGQVSLGGGQSLEGDGTIKTVGMDSRATLALTDGTEIALLGDTSFSTGTAAGQRRLFLDAGTLRSTVVRQPEQTPLVFGTADVAATVRGTELALVKDGMGTYLIVTRGAVALRRASGGAEVLVNSGYYSHVESTGAFRPWPIERLPKAVREQALLQK